MKLKRPGTVARLGLDGAVAGAALQLLQRTVGNSNGKRFVQPVRQPLVLGRHRAIAPLTLAQWAVCVAMVSSVQWVGELRNAVMRVAGHTAAMR